MAREWRVTVRASAETDITVEANSAEEAEELALDQAKRFHDGDWDNVDYYEAVDHEDLETEEEKTERMGELGCDKLSPCGDYVCTHHKDGMHCAFDSDENECCDPWPIEETSEDDEPAEVTDGCCAVKNNFSCTHHRLGMHVGSFSQYPEPIRACSITGRKPFEWPIEKTSTLEIEPESLVGSSWQ